MAAVTGALNQSTIYSGSVMSHSAYNVGLGLMNIAAAVGPILGYASHPNKTSFSEAAFDVFCHSVRIYTFFADKPSGILLNLAIGLDSVRLALIIKNTWYGTSTFPAAIRTIDSVIHGVNLASALKA
jgi:hypothetical protein